MFPLNLLHPGRNCTIMWRTDLTTRSLRLTRIAADQVSETQGREVAVLTGTSARYVGVRRPNVTPAPAGSATASCAAVDHPHGPAEKTPGSSQ